MMPKPKEEARPWLCKSGHLVGHVERDNLGWKLILYEQSIDPRWPSKDVSPVKRAILRGPAIIRCTICHKDKEWEANQEMMDRLMERLKRGKTEKSIPVASLLH
jgi:hypothetical protein